MAQLKKINVVITSGTSLSAVADLSDGGMWEVVGIVMPDTWTAANLTFQSALDVTYQNVYKEDGTEYTVTAAASRNIGLDPVMFRHAAKLKIRSGTSGSAVNQTADRTVTLLLRSR